MNPLTQFKKILILPLLIALSLIVVVPARATPSCGLSTVILALEHFPSGSLDLMCNELQQYGWDLKTKVKGDSDVSKTRFHRELTPGGTRTRVPAWSRSRRARLPYMRPPTPPALPTFTTQATASPT